MLWYNTTTCLLLYRSYISSIERISTQCANHMSTWAQYILSMTVWIVLFDVFTQKMSHREQGVSVTSCLSMHMIVTSFSFTHLHTSTQTHHELKVFMSYWSRQWTRAIHWKVIMRETALPPMQSSTSVATAKTWSPIKFGRPTWRVLIFAYMVVSPHAHFINLFYRSLFKWDVEED